jgi:Txe/YoeB family toxin of Txe-Axe toxin-antitoxin module
MNNHIKLTTLIGMSLLVSSDYMQASWEKKRPPRQSYSPGPSIVDGTVILEMSGGNINIKESDWTKHSLGDVYAEIKIKCTTSFPEPLGTDRDTMTINLSDGRTVTFQGKVDCKKYPYIFTVDTTNVTQANRSSSAPRQPPPEPLIDSYATFELTEPKPGERVQKCIVQYGPNGGWSRDELLHNDVPAGTNEEIIKKINVILDEIECLGPRVTEIPGQDLTKMESNGNTWERRIDKTHRVIYEIISDHPPIIRVTSVWPHTQGRFT